MLRVAISFSIFVLAIGGMGCGSEDPPAAASPPVIDGPVDDPALCVHPADDVPFLSAIGCLDDFQRLASEPLSAQISGARSVKTVIDRMQSDSVHWQNSKTYKIHWEFASAHLSIAQGLPPVPALADFNTTQYQSPSRRFLLGAVTWYTEPNVWAYEIAPYDTASTEQITVAFKALRDSAWFGSHLVFHPTSEAVASVAAGLPDDVPVISTAELFASITYQPANLGITTGRLRFLTAEELHEGEVHFRDIVVLDHVPNDIGVVAGIITAQHQTPLSHINVLSQNRGTPNMVLVGAFENEELRTLDGQWVTLDVGPFDWSIKGVSADEAEQWWQQNKPAPLGVPTLDVETTELRDITQLLALETAPTLDDPPDGAAMRAALDKAIPAYGGKASHYAGFTYMGEAVPHPKAFAIPVHWYRAHMEANNLDAQVTALLADEIFKSDTTYRRAQLKLLRENIAAAPIDPAFLDAVHAKLDADYPGVRMRFRSSTNAEDLDGFTGAGLYTSKTGDPADPERPVADAIRKVWASIWRFGAFEERQYRSIDHEAVGMALLVHRSFPDEEANGVALTANIFDTSGLEPGFYVNVQKGEESVVFPQPGITTDQFVYQFHQPGQPVIFISHSNLVGEGETVLTLDQTYELGAALDAIHRFWGPTYGPPVDEPTRFYAMDVEFKFDGEPGEPPALFVKQARPHPGWGL